MKRRTAVTVLGAGVNGLTTAHRLARNPAFDVRVVADRIGAETSSRVAGALWLPFHVRLDGPEARTAKWARETYAWLERRSVEPAAGVRGSVPVYVLGSEGDVEPAWSAALPPGRAPQRVARADLPATCVRFLAVTERVRGLPAVESAWRFEAPIVDTELHLGWLLSELAARNVIVEQIPTLRSLDELEADVLVNCTGRRAGSVTDDRLLKPAFGQILVLRDPDLPRDVAVVDDRARAVTLAGGECGQQIAYWVPRTNAVVFGGCDVPIDARRAEVRAPDPPTPDPTVRAALEAELAELGFAPRDVTVLAEFRPVRGDGDVRLEREGRVLHDYGHGGSGFTLAYGCALEIERELLALSLTEP